MPGGFVVTTSAYATFLREAGIQDAIRALLGTINYHDLNDLEAKTAKIRALIANADMPTKVAEGRPQ